MKVLPLSEKEFPRTWEVLESGERDQVAPGFVCGIALSKQPNQYWACALGRSRVIPSPLPISISTFFDLASLTKVMGTAALTAVLVDRGWLNWNTPVQAILGDYAYPRIEIRHLLSHTAGFCAWQPFWEMLRDCAVPRPLDSISISIRQKWMKKLVMGVAPDCEPGEKTVYSDLSFLLLGFVLEELIGKPLDQAVKTWVWDPMGLPTAQFRRVDRRSQSLGELSFAATEDCPWRKRVLEGQVHDDNCWAMGGYAGHAGAFGRIDDVMQFSQAMTQGFFTPATSRALWTRFSTPLDCTRTLGWDMPSGENPSAGRYFSKDSVGHLGFTGTSLWIDWRAGVSVALLTNRVHLGRENHKIREFRPRFHDAVRLDLGF